MFYLWDNVHENNPHTIGELKAAIRYLKDNVYENNPQTIGELKAAITAKTREIPKEECVRVIDKFARPPHNK
jgi:hypothetical protein